MADKTLTFRRGSNPGDVTFILTDFRDETDPDTAVNITGYGFKLIVKRDLTDSDANALFPELAGSIVTAADGSFKFALTHAHTSMAPGSYPGEIRWWSGGAATGKPPTDSWTVDWVITQEVAIAEA